MKKFLIALLVIVAVVVIAALLWPNNNEVEDVDERDYNKTAVSNVSDSELQTDSSEDINNTEDVTEDEIINADGLRADFKKAMDEYEDFYDEYCQFMKKYKANPTDLTLLTEYTNMLTELGVMDEAFKKWESEELNDAELAYYLEVSSRITKSFWKQLHKRMKN